MFRLRKCDLLFFFFLHTTTTTATDNLSSFPSLTFIRNRNQGEHGPAGPRDLNDAILEPAQETLRVRSRQAALAEVIDELDDGTDASDSDVE